MLRDDLHGIVILQHLDVGMAAHRFHQTALDLEARVVGVVKDAKLAVAALAVEVKRAVFLLVKVHTPAQQVADAVRTALDHLLHSSGVADVVAGYHRVLDVLLEVVHLQIGDRSDAALSLGRVGLVECCLAHQRHTALAGVGHFQCKTHAGHSAADNEKIKLAYHDFCLLLMQIYNFFNIFAADMKKKTLLIAFFTGVALALHAEGAWKERTTAALDSLLCDTLFDSTQVALAVWDLTDDSLLYATGYRQRMRPASCQKIITAVTALKALGADFQYRPYVKEAGWGWCWDDKISQPKSPGAPLLSETELQRVDEVMLPMLKESDNLLAESMFQQLADRSGKRGAGRREAAAEVERLIRLRHGGAAGEGVALRLAAGDRPRTLPAGAPHRRRGRHSGETHEGDLGRRQRPGQDGHRGGHRLPGRLLHQQRRPRALLRHHQSGHRESPLGARFSGPGVHCSDTMTKTTEQFEKIAQKIWRIKSKSVSLRRK